MRNIIKMIIIWQLNSFSLLLHVAVYLQECKVHGQKPHVNWPEVWDPGSWFQTCSQLSRFAVNLMCPKIWISIYFSLNRDFRLEINEHQDWINRQVNGQINRRRNGQRNRASIIVKNVVRHDRNILYTKLTHTQTHTHTHTSTSIHKNAYIHTH